MYDFEHLSITQLAAMFGIGRNEMGRRLKEIGFRRWDAEVGGYVPTDHAIKTDLAKRVERDDDQGSFYAWHRERTVAELQKTGLSFAESPQAAPATNGRIHGPFTERPSGLIGCEVLNGDGSVGLWVVGLENARNVVRLLNTAFDNGQFR